MNRSLLAVGILLTRIASSTAGAQIEPNVFSFRGLVALDTANRRALFLSPSGSHPPTLMIDLEDLLSDPEIEPELVIPMGGGRGMAVWTFEDIRLTSNIEEMALDFNADAVSGAGVQDARLAWVPSMMDIVGGTPKIKKSEAKKAKAVMTGLVGTATPWFEHADHLSQCFTINNRTGTAVADVIRVTVNQKVAGQPLFEVKRFWSWKPFHVKDGATVYLTGYPLKKSAKHLDHFHHYFKLIDGDTTMYNPREDTCEGEAGAPGTGPSEFPIRCAPVKFP